MPCPKVLTQEAAVHQRKSYFLLVSRLPFKLQLFPSEAQQILDSPGGTFQPFQLPQKNQYDWPSPEYLITSIKLYVI